MKRKRSLSGRNGGKQEVSVVRKGKLPVLERRKEILDAFRRSDVVILVGDTGSGKTTQVWKEGTLRWAVVFFFFLLRRKEVLKWKSLFWGGWGWVVVFVDVDFVGFGLDGSNSA